MNQIAELQSQRTSDVAQVNTNMTLLQSQLDSQNINIQGQLTDEVAQHKEANEELHKLIAVTHTHLTLPTINPI